MNMWVYGVVVALAISSAVAEEESPFAKCNYLKGMTEMQIMWNIPGMGGLNSICNDYIEVLDCFEDAFVKSLGQTAVQVLESDIEEDRKSGAKLVINLRSLFNDLCSEETELGQAYREHIACFETLPENVKTVCSEEAGTSLESLLNEMEKDPFYNDDHYMCLLQAYKQGCIAAEVYDRCGEEAYKTHLEIVKRTSILKQIHCTAEEIAFTRNQFLTDLKLEEPRLSLFSKAFEYHRRK